MKRNVTFQMNKEDIEKLKELANKENRSMASFLRNIVLELINKNDRTKSN